MKTLTLCTLALLMSSVGLAQDRAIFTKDTISYHGEKYYVGKVVRLSYGSNDNKSFAFAFMGSGMTGYTSLASAYSKFDVLVDKIYKQGRKVYLRGKLLETNVNMLGGNKVLVDIEGAYDFKEILPTSQ